MDVPRGSTANSQHTHSSHDSHKPQSCAYEYKRGRTYLKDNHHPLPVDLSELQRQSLSTRLVVDIIGQPFATPRIREIAPKKVLEVACGSAYWTCLAHEYLCSLGFHDVEFTGIDIAPVPPDLNKSGIKWHFKQVDINKFPLPFGDEEFDMVVCRDLALVVPTELPSQRAIEEFTRILRKGGGIECWDVDLLIRNLAYPNKLDRCLRTATFPISHSTDFAPCRNQYLAEANEWLQTAINNLSLHALPCARIVQLLLEETDALKDCRISRTAIPFGCDKLWWEDTKPTNEQLALRQTALHLHLEFIKSMEPHLIEASKKNEKDWDIWYKSLTDSLSAGESKSDSNEEKRKMNGETHGFTGECMEICVTWAEKIDPKDPNKGKKMGDTLVGTRSALRPRLDGTVSTLKY